MIEDVYNSREGENETNWKPHKLIFIFSISVKFSSVGRRKISLSQLLATDNPELKTANTTFYVGLRSLNDIPVIQATDLSKTYQSSNAVIIIPR